jgi:multidrug efflux pump subunit AcrA (membrane-fusion protein)
MKTTEIMKTKTILIIALAVVLGGSALWLVPRRPVAADAASAGRKILYYQSAMHPWIKSDKPGKCPICGMDLVPIYADEGGTNSTVGGITLNASSVTAVHVQTEAVERRILRRTLRVAGSIVWNEWTQAWFEFDAYQRDLAWLKIGQTVEVTVPDVPDKTFMAQIKLHGVKTFADAKFDDTANSTKVRAEISNPPIEVGGFGSHKLFYNFYAEGRVLADMPDVLTVPRSAVIWPGGQSVVYMDDSGGHYELRAVKLGRSGDEFWEVLDGLHEGEKVVTTGNLLIDSEAQLANGR